MSFTPNPTKSGFVALLIVLVAGFVTILLINSLLQQNNPNQLFFDVIKVLLALTITSIALYWAIVVLRLNYHLNRNGLVIKWGLAQQQIPFTGIKDIVVGETIATDVSFTGLNLVGLRLGWGESITYGSLKFRTTAAVEQSLLVTTATATYIISPQQPQAFINAWQRRQSLGPTQQWAEETQRRWPLTIPLLADPLTWWLLGLAALLCLALFGYVALQYADLPQALPVHFNSLGRADRIAPKAMLLILPLAGFLVWLINALIGSLAYRKEQVAAYLLWGSSITMQLCLWVAVLTITS